MVCKEDVLSWFKDLECYKRIDVMFELLNMCVPFEVRFLGSCIEEIGKHSYQELRGCAIIANDVEKLSKDSSLQSSLLDEGTRHRVIIYISLLSARNCSCANWFYKNLFRTDKVEEYVLKKKCKEENVLSELLLLFTLGMHHPAFSFEQKRYFMSMLVELQEQKEGRKHIPLKPSVYSCPPGFGFPPQPKIPLNISEVPIIPVKTASLISVGEVTSTQQPPPGLPPHPVHPPHPVMEFGTQTMWTRPGFTSSTCGAPEAPPFPPPPVSPLVSQATSPPLSRAASPHRTFNLRPTMTGQVVAPIPQVDVIPTVALPPLEPVPQSSLPPHLCTEVKSSEEEINQIPEEKLRDHHPTAWIPPLLYDLKPPNGYNYTQFHKIQAPFVMEQMQALNLDGDSTLHCSDSSSSSSINQSPPETPTATPSVTPHCPGRGDPISKTRLNGIPPFGPPLCDGNAPPPPPFSNCTVPYSTCYPHVTLTAIPSRSIFQYSQAYRPQPFNTQFTYPPENVYPYVPLVYSSGHPHASPVTQRLNCYNCGAMGHDANDCTGQTIEEITQKAYSLEYAPPLQEPDKTS